MGWNPLSDRTNNQRNVIDIIIDTLSTGAVAVLTGNQLYVWLAVALIVKATHKIFHYGATLGPKKNRLLSGLLRTLYKVLSFPEEHKVRCTLFLPNERKKFLYQLARYGSSGAETSDSKIDFGKGVAGKCYGLNRVKDEPEVFLGALEDNADFHEYMLDRGFTPEEASKFDSSRRSYLCVPLVKDGSVLGIMSLDSNNRYTFGSPDPQQNSKVKPDDKVVEIVEHFSAVCRVLLST